MTGSLPGSASETDATNNQLNGSGGFGTLTYALVSGGNAPTAGTFGTIQVNADGSYVYTLTKPFDTSPDANNGTNTEVAESFSYRVTDANGNTATGTITVNIIDDVPTVIFPEAAALPNEVGGTFVGDLDTNSDVNNNAGADGLGSVRFPTTLNGAPSNLTSGGLPIIYYVTADGHTLTGAVGPNAATGPIFTIVLTDGATDTYAITMIGTVDGGATNVNFDLTAGYDFEGGNSSWLAFFKAGNDNSHDLLMTPAINGLPAQSINSTANFGGVNNAFVGTTQGLVETFRIDFVTDVQDGGGVDDTAVVGPGNNYGLPANRNHTFDSHYLANGAFTSFRVTGGGETTLNIRATDDDDVTILGNAEFVVGDGAIDDITAIVIRNNGAQQVITADGPYSVGGRTFTVDFDPAGGNPFGPNGNNTVNVTGLIDGVQIATLTADGYTTLEYSYVTGSDFQIGNFGGTVIQTGVPVNFAVPVQLVDGDGDAAGGSIGVTLTPEGVPTVTITDDEVGTATIAGGSILYTFQFSEMVTGFDAADITVVNGTKGRFTAVDGDTYTLVVTPMADFQGILAVGVAAGVAFNAAVTPNTAAALSVQVVDTLAPAVAVDIVEGALNDGVTGSIVTFAFSEAPGASFTKSDIQVSAGLTLVGGSLTMVDATHYTATVNAADGFTGNATVSLVAGSYTDAALNLGLGGSDAVTVTGGASAPPVLDLDANDSNGGGSDYTSTFTIGGPAIPIADIDVKITDPDSTTMASARISMISKRWDPAE